MPNGDRGVDEDKRSTLRRFAALGAATPLAGLGSGEAAARSSADGSDVRDAILGYVSTTPGAHFSKLRDDLQLGTGETQHHLRRLLDDGDAAGRRSEDPAIVSRRDGDYRRFFVADRFSTFEQVALGYLRRETPRGMLLTLLRHPDATGSAVADAIGVSRATVSTYASELVDAGLLARDDGYVVARPETIITLLVRYADSFDAEVRAFAAEADDLVRYDP
ncbi:winged helix-turn-helix transcriptional regulator [Haloplanus rallus]|jgi:predicted transcriptional regulator|uniref:Winged helix-turn-helix transcriptional regulator n=1 Tax=Haloplanus rallus TaxID=1816183 RepID=A0A6B9F8H4_9EURY|nr:winged helix-turn-helix transcriptional regulator [Haloplanus rallus]QGX94684.1 winged helix-turn-helix transcriptional regulator [Haloplanus rallus]